MAERLKAPVLKTDGPDGPVGSNPTPSARRYGIIYADPPWEYRGRESTGGGNPLQSSANHHYPTMDVESLKLLDVKKLADDDCLLFMWATGPKLDDAMAVGEAWGFTYATIGFVWDKVRTNPGYYTMSQYEICLIFKCGRIPSPRGARNIRQHIQQPRGRHSAKPHEVRIRIDEMFPNHPKIELFARERVPGWDAWGNEV